MKIAINAWFCNQINTGSGQYLHSLIPALLTLDSTLEIVLIAPEFAIPSPQPDWAAKVQCYPVPLKPGNGGKVIFEQFLFPRAAQQLNADVAHVPYFGSALKPLLPTVVTIHDVIPIVLPQYRGGPRVRPYTAVVCTAAAHANLILADSETSRTDILTHLRLPPDKVRTVYLAAAPHYHPADSQEQLKYVTQKYNLPENFALYMGGYDVRKNLSALIHAWTYVTAGLGDDLKLVLAGKLPAQDTSFFPSPVNLAKKLGVADSLVTPGWIDEADKPLLYSAARLFVFPSLYEGFGLPVLEAMACRTPVVTTNAASLPELTGAHAFQSDPTDTRRMAGSIIALTVQDNTHADLAERGYRQSLQFSWEKTARQTLTAYRDVIL